MRLECCRRSRVSRRNRRCITSFPGTRRKLPELKKESRNPKQLSRPVLERRSWCCIPAFTRICSVSKWRVTTRRAGWLTLVGAVVHTAWGKGRKKGIKDRGGERVSLHPPAHTHAKH